MLTRHARPGVLRKALRLGVQGFVSESAEPAHITSVIAKLHQGKRWVDPDVSVLAVIDDCPLTDRELDVLRATGEGYSVADIADRLHPGSGHRPQLPVQRHAEDPDADPPRGRPLRARTRLALNLPGTAVRADETIGT
jgi:hypothetical protein